MDSLMSLFTWQFMLFSLAIAGETMVLRLIVEYTNKTHKKYKGLWEDLLLPLFPLAIGSLMGVFVGSYPYPEGIAAPGARVMFGLVAGMFSNIAYRAIKAMMNLKVVQNGGNSDDNENNNNIPGPLPMPPAPHPSDEPEEDTVIASGHSTSDTSTGATSTVIPSGSSVVITSGEEQGTMTTTVESNPRDGLKKQP